MSQVNRGSNPAPTEMIFYDGHCGLCHWAVRFVLAQDQDGDAFRFSPLGSAAFVAAVPESERVDLPDSMVVHTAEGRVLTRSDGLLHILRRLGGRWRFIAIVAAVVPAVVRNRLYDVVARTRHRLFRRPADACPLIPPHLRARFDL